MKNRTVKKTTFVCWILACALSLSVQAQEMPAPRRMPRVPVSSEALDRDPMPVSRQLQGAAAIIDGERLRIADTDLRLFGIVPPQLSASFGPQARAALDALANGQSVSCQIRDRDHDGRLLATCLNASGVDMALELLKRGLAVTARGSLTGSELATSYLATEQTAQNQKLGLWSGTAPSPVSFSSPSVAPKTETAAASPVPVPTPVEVKKDDKVAPRTDKAASDAQAKITADVISQHTQAQNDDKGWAMNDNVGFFERYQILIAGLLMLTTALSIIGALWAQKRRDRLDEIKAVAAALRGELMAARGICQGRIKSITNEEEDTAATWPRIRSTLYQAYVGRIGLLGAELARQIAAIYGQSSDYAALYNPSGAINDAPKKHALENLARRMDEVLPKLAFIEQSGTLPASTLQTIPLPHHPRSHYDLPTQRIAPQQINSPAAHMIEMREPEETHTEHPVLQEATPAVPEPPAVMTEVPAKTSVAMWEAVRGFIQNHRNAIAQQPSIPDTTTDPHVAEYAAMIEADMARHHYGENIEALDISPKKKQG